MNDSVGVSTNTWQWYEEVIKSWLEDPGVLDHEGLNITALNRDQAYMVGIADLNVGVYSVSDDCFRCPFEWQKTLLAHEEGTWKVQTARRSTWRVYADLTEQYVSAGNTSGLLCQLRPQMGEFGVYKLNVTLDGCDVRTTKEPVDIYMRKFILYSLDTPTNETWVCCQHLRLLAYGYK
ncbi:unnamed protein product [Arctia plantaginis]|uniref:Uncharacterized protein n=1 Tax=Arctia plantaginis TaxID=874455 RepID=A0A8S1BEC4_ARCPL|nr:unnamed protein product [Arctia plantaginis]